MKQLTRAQLRALNKSLEHRLGREKKWSALLKQATEELLRDIDAALKRWADAVGVVMDDEQVPVGPTADIAPRPPA